MNPLSYAEYKKCAYKHKAFGLEPLKYYNKYVQNPTGTFWRELSLMTSYVPASWEEFGEELLYQTRRQAIKDASEL